MDAAISKAIAETGANSMKQMGAVVKAAKLRSKANRRRQNPQRPRPRPPVETGLIGPIHSRHVDHAAV